MFILPAMIFAGWIPTWWGSRRLRWILLSTVAVVSALCVVIGWQATGPPTDPRTVGCSPAIQCMDFSSLYVVVAGLLGLACWVALLVLTLVGELIVHVSRKPSA